MSFNPITVKTAINNAVELSTQGKLDQACDVFSTAILSRSQCEKIRAILAATTSKTPAQCIAQKVQLLTLLTQPEKVEPPAKVLDGYNTKWTKINFIGPAFVDGMSLKEHFNRKGVEQGILQTKEMDIYCYHDVEKLRSDFNFKTNGFQFCALSHALTDHLENFALTPYDKDCESYVSQFGTQFIASWAKKNEIPFDVIVPLGLVYRDQDESAINAGKPYAFAHVDFQRSNLASTADCLEKSWKPAIESVLGELSSDAYRNLSMGQIVNLWMPLNKRPTVNGLIVMDASTMDSAKDLKPVSTLSTDQGCFLNSLSLRCNSKQKWVAQETMTIGHGVIFNSECTPHTAGDLPREGVCDKYRRSLEGRWVCIKF